MINDQLGSSTKMFLLNDLLDDPIHDIVDSLFFYLLQKEFKAPFNPPSKGYLHM